MNKAAQVLIAIGLCAAASGAVATPADYISTGSPFLRHDPAGSANEPRTGGNTWIRRGVLSNFAPERDVDVTGTNFMLGTDRAGGARTLKILGNGKHRRPGRSAGKWRFADIKTSGNLYPDGSVFDGPLGSTSPFFGPFPRPGEPDPEQQFPCNDETQDDCPGYTIANAAAAANQIPEPTSLALVGLGLLGLPFARRWLLRRAD